MDFYAIGVRTIEKGPKKGTQEVYPDYLVKRSKDLMVRGRAFYAIWDEKAGLWSTDEYDIQRLMDEELNAKADEIEKETGVRPTVRSLSSFGTNSWSQFRKYLQNISDHSHQLDDHMAFADTPVKKTDYISKRMPYSLQPGDHSAWDALVGRLYEPEERAKIEWAIGAVVSGDAKRIQKFLVLYGSAGTGKSTILNIIQKMFDGYTTTFEAKALGMSSGAFATEVFKNNPLVAIQHDGDLSRIEDNTRLNSIISHEEMTMNEKYKPSYTARVNAFLFMGTNQPVKISDAKSGIIRRLIDVKPSGKTFTPNEYQNLITKVDFEIGAIAHHCLQVYRSMGKNAYSGYRPKEMMLQTNVFVNYVEDQFDVFKSQDGTTLKQAYALYKEYCDSTGIDKPLPQYKFREELRNYFDHFEDRATVEGKTVRSVYSGFQLDKFSTIKTTVKEDISKLVLDQSTSLLDDLLKDQPAQNSRTAPDGGEIPEKYWTDKERLIGGELKKPKPSQVCSTTLKDIDTTKVHFVKVPANHIVIDFDLVGEDGEKSLDLNLAAASTWPATYAEVSKSGKGVHLHYDYTGPDLELLDQNYADGIEVKVYSGDSSLRRRVSRCNNVPVAPISSGLPLKEKKMLSSNTIQSEKGLRDLVERNLRKEIHPGTKPSIDFIAKILSDAYSEGLEYDLTDLRPRILAFANNSSNQALTCLKTVQQMKFKSGETKVQAEGPRDNEVKNTSAADDRIVFFDVEVYPNLFLICWKFEGEGTSIVKMINPKPAEVEALFKLKLVGFNNRRYDNHILYAAFMGYSNEELYKLSQKMIADNNRGALFGEAYNLSYADIYDFSSKKQGLKKFMIELGITKQEMEIPWDQPVPDNMVEKVIEYCCNDVEATEAVFNDRRQDFVARQILADLSGLSVNETTQKHTAQIIFGNDRQASRKFLYTDLSETFPGYKFEAGVSEYKGVDPSEGGYVYAQPGMYQDVAVLDVASMHPTSIIELNLFGDDYTPNFKDLLDARIAIKRGEYDRARKMLDGKLTPYLTDEKDAAKLSYALKIVINIVYGLTSAKFDNAFRDVRNRDNIVAKRGALFMIDLKEFVENKGFEVAHIKTDSIKIPFATPEIIQEVTEFGKKYGYDFEHEATYDSFCLVNDAVYIARKGDEWEAVGAQFKHPYVFKKLFSKETITFNDLCETKNVVQGAIYVDLFHDTREGDTPIEEMQFIGKIGRFVPVDPGFGGGVLYRVKDGKAYAVTGTKGHLWVEAHVAETLPETAIDYGYFETLVEKAFEQIEFYGPFSDLLNEEQLLSYEPPKAQLEKCA
ncbi:DNA polymerase [Gordonia phage Secretariat]|uniref:DNA primase/polymerase n=1 Tax=Gordonia phage Secretariat TaxID=2725616 RepID=A0A6M3SV99_9CAUD|nr:DNA polymerase [Gordonia phage Secretariat]QJD49637.1 DNA primase/polymerase [Gordonia phage Secretariat]